MTRILDISQPLGEATAVWPGDHEVGVGWTMKKAAGASVNVAAISLSVHAGTHVDGPFHFDDDGARAGELPLDTFVGRATVIDARGRNVVDTDAVQHIDLRAAGRVLFRTRERVDATAFPAAFAAIAPALAQRLGEAGVRLVGTDAPSVDPVDSKTLDSHHTLGRLGVAILENLVLDHVEPGTYTLIALPLRLVEADSSPVRAVLVADEIP